MTDGSITVFPDSPDSYEVVLEAGEVLEVGRKPTTTGNRKLIISVPEVSAEHAVIRPQAGSWVVCDLGSTNGTRLNGRQLVARQEYLICSGDLIQVAEIKLLVKLPEDDCQASGSAEEPAKLELAEASVLAGTIGTFSKLSELFAHQHEVAEQAAQLIIMCVCEEVERHHGKLLHIGSDTILCSWESDNTSPVHVFQACYTALRLRTLVRMLGENSAYWPFPDCPLAMEMAVSTRLIARTILIGCGVDPKRTVELLGLPLDRLFGHAAAIVVDEATFKHTSDHFNFQRQGSFSIEESFGPGEEIYRLVGQKRLE